MKIFQTPAPRQGLSSQKKLKLPEEPTGISKKSNTHPALAFTLCKVLSGGHKGIKNTFYPQGTGTNVRVQNTYVQHRRVHFLIHYGARGWVSFLLVVVDTHPRRCCNRALSLAPESTSN